MARAVRAGTRVDTALLATCALLGLLATVLPTSTRDALAGGLQRSVAAPFLALQRRSERAHAAFVEREGVMLRVDSLALRVRELSQLEAENVRLRRLLELGRRLGHGFVAAEAMHAQGIGDAHALVLTVGQRAGVVPRSAVVAPTGIVGLVTSVTPATANAIAWSHPDFRVSAMSRDGETFGIVTPHLSGDAACVSADASCASAERLLLELRGVAVRDVLQPGTAIVSSGLGGVFPKGIVIGTVLGEIKTAEQWTRTYLLRPAVRPAEINNVMVIAPSRVTDDLSAAWDLPPEAVAARVAAAGDSVQRGVVADLLARQRAADSTAAAAQAAQLARDSAAILVPGAAVRLPAPGARRAGTDSVRRP